MKRLEFLAVALIFLGISAFLLGTVLATETAAAGTIAELTAVAPAPPTAPADLAPLIVIDAGHSGSTLLTVDPQFQMNDYEYSNGQENVDNFKVATKLKEMLDAKGYRTLMTKTGPFDTVSKRDRIDLANNNGAALFVFIHRDAHTFGSWGHVYPQFIDGWRANIHGTKVYFGKVCPDAADVVARSLAISKSIVKARQAIEGSAVCLATEDYANRGGNIPAGNLSILSLWATVPSILVEAGIPNTDAKVEKYAQGLCNGIVEAIPVDGSTPPAPAPPAPSVKFSNLVEGQVLRLHTTVTIKATVMNACKVLFYLDGILRKTDTAAPFSYTLTPGITGKRTFKAVAFDRSGASATTIVHVIVK